MTKPWRYDVKDVASRVNTLLEGQTRDGKKTLD